MRDIIKKILRVLATLTLARYKPRIVAITGSAGKTSTKEAAAIVLKTKFSVRRSLENYNNEFGVLLTIIGQRSAGKNPLLWLFIFLKALLNLIYMSYPKILVLELGADRLPLSKVEVGILEGFAKDNINLIKNIDTNGLAILNFDDPKIYESRTQTQAEVIGYGFGSKAQVLISEFQIIEVNANQGINFKIHYRGNVIPFFLPNVLDKPAAYAAAAASAVALHFGIDLGSASQALKVPGQKTIV